MKKITTILIAGLLACNVQATYIRYIATNVFGTADTNYLIIRPIGSPIRADGSFVTRGAPFRIYPNASGTVTTNIAAGNYLATNAVLATNICFAVPTDSTTNVYDLADLAISGFNTYNYTPGVRSLTAGSGITLSATTGDVTIASTGTSGNAAVATNWLGMTNFTATVSQRVTDQVVLALAGTVAARGTYYYNAASQCMTNATGCFIEFSSPMTPTITNSAGDYLYSSLGPGAGTYPMDWETFTGAEPPPTGYIPTNTTFAVAGYRATTNFTYDFPGGLSGTRMNLGPTHYNAVDGTDTNTFGGFGNQVNLSGTTFDQNDYPSAFISSSQCFIDGASSLNTIISSSRSKTHGSQQAIICSGLIDLWCTNADYAVIASEFGVVQNGNGIAATIACNGFADYSPATAYAMIAAGAWTNTYMMESAVLGGRQLTGMGASLFNMAGSVGINTGSSTNTLNNSVVIGPNMRMTNLDSSTVIGQAHNAVNATNVFLLGSGLTTTSNNVVKIGFTGAQLNVSTNGTTLNTSLLVTNGIASYSTVAAVSIAATGWTNIWTTNNATVYVTATAVAFTIKNRANATIYTSPTVTATIPVHLQPGWSVNAASGLSGTALPE